MLAPLYQRLLVPHTVARELQQPNTPATIRAWIAQLPACGGKGDRRLFSICGAASRPEAWDCDVTNKPPRQRI
jgi:hypothetical protein